MNNIRKVNGKFVQMCENPNCDRAGQWLPVSEFGKRQMNKKAKGKKKVFRSQPRCIRCRGSYDNK